MSIANTPIPHMLPEDTEVFMRWLHRYGSLFDSFDYDVRVGQGRDPGPTYPQNIRQMAISLSQRRIDCVAYRRDSIHIIEVTKTADMTALGQVTAYPILFRQTYETTARLIPAVVCEHLGSDVEIAYRRSNVTIYRV